MTSPPDDSEWLRVGDVVRALHRTERAVRRYVAAGSLEARFASPDRGDDSGEFNAEWSDEYARSFRPDGCGRLVQVCMALGRIRLGPLEALRSMVTPMARAASRTVLDRQHGKSRRSMSRGA